ncbi:uroporphyrin-III C-methyltransferase/precorrin-2 dehydrogenase/sirohydrochlorin ferrochelatase [Isoptericola sp. CG 20/1183]|uniref:uroporphyrinogen-III C-methyltransferase n=1 Tax=Isoptericola halotolerans TaxID=300560 RepID=A0ABX5EE15_9MICO|nr:MULTISPECIES: uroporphyrinogen-III C-methyltransferase [Isoptericola]PRZ04800.1 uroporphyrin-III C-methyltransferase/precorrin-2 dehydrogenase/sirohydrochlorin ferrochelatase [Isoptericola halotolerans]PRZ05291.1 uroporphyrin-III C-methyltransferase/precorrin-2 dehydrogenase/sirohydrochlorin ferrochelatase [Isoptericola sp. CG 20/1183]
MTAQAGHVTLVGAGPGAADLLTYRAWRAIARADVVVHDRLVPLEILEDLGEHVEVIDVGKAPGRHKVPQDEINALLVRRGLAGRRVVRLKGGDPFVFGRGGEEYAACTTAGVAVDVVPGVSSALSVPALAGIPLTHRGTTTAFHVVTAHTRSGERELDDVAVACVTERAATLVILMGVSSLPAIVTRLLDAGAAPDTPVAIVERGSTPEQRVTRVGLDLAAKRADELGVRAPAVIVVGDVAAPGLLEGVSDRGDVGDPRG